MRKYQLLIFLPNGIKYDRPTFGKKEEHIPLTPVIPITACQLCKIICIQIHLNVKSSDFHLI